MEAPWVYTRVTRRRIWLLTSLCLIFPSCDMEKMSLILLSVWCHATDSMEFLVKIYINVLHGCVQGSLRSSVDGAV